MPSLAGNQRRHRLISGLIAKSVDSWTNWLGRNPITRSAARDQIQSHGIDVPNCGIEKPFIGLLTVLSAMNPQPVQPVETAQQVQSRQDALKRQTEIEAAATARMNTLCRARVVCMRYHTARQNCAVAGDFNNCITVKMENDLSALSNCTNDGALRYPPENMPTVLDCLPSNIKNLVQ